MLETLLCIASFAFYRSSRFFMRRLIVLNARLNQRRAHQWQVLSAESLKLPLALPAIMTAGPRWNPHAMICGAGPFDVKQEMRVDLEALQLSAKSWTLVIYTFPDQRTVAHVGTLQAPFRDRWHSVTLPAGKYGIALRLYHWGSTVTLPEILADGAITIPSRSVPSESNDFYRDLQKKRSTLYLWFHYYIYCLLRGTSSIPGVSTKREFLPMGNPETEFRYGALARGESLRVSLPNDLPATHDVYFTLYTRDSFPSRWYQIQDRTHTTAPVDEDGFYLLRIHRISMAQAKHDMSAVAIETVPARSSFS